MGEDHAIVRDSDLLNENYAISNISSREKQMRKLTQCLSPANERNKPVHVWIFGRPGTGKTLVSRHILKNMEKESHVKGAYINCWENSSYYSVLDKLVRILRILGAEKLNTSYKLERLKQCLGNKPFIIILDEIDKPKRHERDSIIYNLCNAGKIGLMCVCNSPFVLYSLDERIRSRLNAKQVEFNPYSKSELIRILKQRARLALNSRAWNLKTIRKIAELAAGDARVAIQTLKNSALNAEHDLSDQIKDKHVLEGFNSAKELKKSYLLNKLSSHHRLLFDLVQEKKSIHSGHLWKVYLERCEKLKKQPIALRTFSEYMNKLIELGLVQWDRALVRGKVRVFKVVS